MPEDLSYIRQQTCFVRQTTIKVMCTHISSQVTKVCLQEKASLWKCWPLYGLLLIWFLVCLVTWARCTKTPQHVTWMWGQIRSALAHPWMCCRSYIVSHRYIVTPWNSHELNPSFKVFIAYFRLLCMDHRSTTYVAWR